MTRRAFPRGYTETLEERIRELENENKKLSKIIDLKNEEFDLVTKPDPMSTNLLTDENLKLFNDNNDLNNKLTHTHHDGTPCNCNNYPHSVHERPVSIAGSVDLSNDEDDYNALINPLRRERNANYQTVSFEQQNAPGAALLISLQKKLQNQNFINLSTLIAMSIPRTTLETLFIPSLLAKICNVHGFNSKLLFATAKTISSLKENYQDFNKNYFPSFKLNFNKLEANESILFFQNLKLPNQVNLDLFITNFFENWNKVIPILNKEQFLIKYLKFTKSRESNFKDGSMVGEEKFLETLILVITLVMLSQERNNSSLSTNSGIKIENSPKMFKDNSNFEILQYYNHIIHEFIHSNINQIASLSTIQNLSLDLLFCLSIGDLTNSYDIRGKLITMSQQLRLHRCPSAVLGNNGSNVSQLQQGERRILFWCTYILDTFSALILGVPRLLKDFEIECALPFSNEENLGNNINESNLVIINNDKLSLVGKVCNMALAIMRYSKILGNIVDSIFKRTENNNQDFCLMFENLLNNWKKNLPDSLNFDKIDTTKIDLYHTLNEQQLLLIFLYYYAKMLVYLPNLSKEMITKKSSPTYIIIQQSTQALLNITNILSSQSKNFYYLPLPFNLSREKVRISLLYATGSLEYARGGTLFQDSRNLLQSIINDLKIENGIGMLGCLSDNCIDNLDVAIESILSAPNSKKPVTKKKSIMTPPNLPQQQQRGVRTLPVVPQQHPLSQQQFPVQDKMSIDVPDLPTIPSQPVSLDTEQYNDAFADFTVDGSIGLNSLLDFEFEFPFDNNTRNGSTPPPPLETSTTDTSTSESLFNWQTKPQPQQD